MTTEKLLPSFGDAAPTRLRLSKRTVALLAMVVIPMVGVFLADLYLQSREPRIPDLPPLEVLLAMASVEVALALQAPTPESELLPVE